EWGAPARHCSSTVCVASSTPGSSRSCSPSMKRRAVPQWVSDKRYVPSAGAVNWPDQRTEMLCCKSSDVTCDEPLNPAKSTRLTFTVRSRRTSEDSPSKRGLDQYSALSPAPCSIGASGDKTADGIGGGPGKKSPAETGSVPSAYTTRVDCPARCWMPFSMLTP